jgi:phosphoribosyl 1,2-cyclic phosphodiesterase
MMRATIWGCRGSLAAPGRKTVRYGGNTSCVEVRADDGSFVVLDAGTGLRPFGVQVEEERPPRIDVLLTHLHLDHLEGLGFFRPVWHHETELHLWGPPSPTRTLEERIARYLSPPLFPIDISDVPADLHFHDVPDEPWELGGLSVRAQRVSHPGPTVGYRIENNGSAMAYVPDHEPALGVPLEDLGPDWTPGYDLAAGADVLLHDSQFTEEEYPERVGWGHSSVAHAVTFAQRAEVGRLVLFHHDPWRTDEELELLHQRACALWNGGGAPPELAYEGMEITVSSYVRRAIT